MLPHYDTVRTAIRLGQKDRIEHFLNTGLPLDFKGDGFIPLLHQAAADGHSRIIELLLQKGADIHSTDGVSALKPIHAAILNNHPEAVQILIQYGADYLTPNILQLSFTGNWLKNSAHRGLNALDLARQAKRDQIVDILTYSKETKTEALPLSIEMAIRLGNQTTVKRLLDINTPISRTDAKDTSLIHLAAQCGQSRIIELLLERGADMHSLDRDQAMPLHIAVIENNLEVVQILAAYGADLSKPWINHYGRNALHLAAEHDHVEIAEFLVTRSEIDIHQPDTLGLDALALTDDLPENEHQSGGNESKVGLLLMKLKLAESRTMRNG